MLPDKVADRESFIKFLEALKLDLETNESQWENITLGDFLDAAGRYTEDIQGYYDNTKQNINADEPSWRVFADILKGASMYE